MNLITAAAAKAKFELWEDYCTIPGSVQTPEQVFANKISDAEAEMLQYLPDLTLATITENQERHLINIIRYRCFQIKHGDTQFETDPAIVYDYKQTIDWLKNLQSGDGFSLAAKDRVYTDGNWFTDAVTDLTSSES